MRHQILCFQFEQRQLPVRGLKSQRVLASFDPESGIREAGGICVAWRLRPYFGSVYL